MSDAFWKIFSGKGDIYSAANDIKPAESGR